MDLSRLMCAPANLTIGDIVACNVMRLPCSRGHFDWPKSSRPKTFVTAFDDLMHHAALVTPHMLRNAGCIPRPNDWGAKLARPFHSEVLAAGAVQRCGDWRGLEALLLAFDAPFLDAPRCPLHLPARQYCELELESAATWDAVRQVAQTRGFVCKVSADAPARSGQQNADSRIATLAGAGAGAITSDVTSPAAQPLAASSNHQKTIAVILVACMASTAPCGAADEDGVPHIRQQYAKSVRAWAAYSSMPVVFVERSGANISDLRQLPSVDRRASFEFLSTILMASGGSERVDGAADAPDLTVALSVVYALEHSWILRRTATGADDLIFLTAAHHYVPGLQVCQRLQPAKLRLSQIITQVAALPVLAGDRPSRLLEFGCSE